jgi:SEC-C motif/Nuclease-related domain
MRQLQYQLRTIAPMRNEQEIFDELATLCTSSGYVHAIAYLCFRDSMVLYGEEMTAEDMQRLFSPEHLVRTEISTLIGLLIKENIDYALPTAAVTQQYITRTEELLEEMHNAMSAEMFGGLGMKEVVESGINPFNRGAALREPIFYAGESAYWFQYRDISPRKYAADNEWLKANRGFLIQDARDVVDALGKLQDEKLTTVMDAFRHSPPDTWTFLPGFSFTADELSRFSGIESVVVEKVLAAFTLAHGEKNKNFHALHDFNVVNAFPVLRAQDHRFILFQRYSIAEALYDSPFYWMSGDDAYRDSAMMHRGQFTEQFSRERLELVFGKNNVYSNVDIYDKKSQRVGEIDVLVIFGDRAVVLQAKSKRLTLEARKGNDNQIKDDFKKSVQDSYDQGYGCARLLGDPRLTFIATNAQVVRVPQKLKCAYILCVVSDNYPALSFQARQFLKFHTDERIRPPFVMDTFTLDVMTEMLESPLYFLSYVDKRTAYSDKLMAPHELVLLSHHLKRNLWFDEKYDMVLLEDDISADLDVAMAVRRDNVPGRRTPDGVLTRIANTAVGRMLKEIEARSDPATIDLGFRLLTLSEHAVVKLSEAIDMIAKRARQDGKSHDASVPLNEAAAGLTIHCNDEPISTAGPKLRRHCVMRKYAEKADTWYGVCVLPSDTSLRFGVNLSYKWEASAQMDAAVSHLAKPRRLADVLGAKGRNKIGRNEPCPCGSGLKFKKCCGK